MDTTQPNQPDIFTRLGMASATDEQKQQLAEQLADLTMTRVLSKVSDQITEEQMNELERLIDAGGDQVDDRLRQLVPNYDELIASTAQEVGDQLVADQAREHADQQFLVAVIGVVDAVDFSRDLLAIPAPLLEECDVFHLRFFVSSAHSL